MKETIIMYIALKEVYFGKTKNLLECEKLLAEIKKEWDGKYYDPAKIEYDPRMLQIGRLLATEFGLKKVIIEVLSLPVANAVTVPISWGIDVGPTFRTKSNLIADKNGFKFKPEAGYVVGITLYTGLICNPNITAGEIMATIIHEFGHNFQAVIDDTCFMLTDITNLSKILYSVVIGLSTGRMDNAISMGLVPFIYSSKFKDIVDSIDKKLQSYELIALLYHYMTKIDGINQTMSTQFRYFLVATLGYVNAINPVMYLKQVVQGLFKTVLDPLGYRGERIADNFVTAYGYGPELATVLMKFETKNYEELPLNKLANILTPVGIFLRTGIGLGSMVGALFDPHPASVERCLDQVRYLKEELKYTTDKEARTIYLNQINEIERNLEAVVKQTDLKKHWDIVSYTMALITYNNGGDLRHNVLGKDIHRNIQKTYDEKRSFVKPKLI